MAADKDVYEIALRFDIEPASVQSSRTKKDGFAAVVKAAIARYPFYIVDDVTLEIEWVLSEKAKYESDKKADIDNILKPLIDSMTGPDGLLVDDTSVQSLYCGWLSHTLDTDVVHVRMKSQKTESISEVAIDRDALIFVETEKSLFMPIDQSLPASVNATTLQLMMKRIAIRDHLRTVTGSYGAAQNVMPQQRYFHKSRIVKFPHCSVTEFAARIGIPLVP